MDQSQIQIIDHQGEVIEALSIVPIDLSRKRQREFALRKVGDLSMVQMRPEFNVFIANGLENVIQVPMPVNQIGVRSAVVCAATKPEDDQDLAIDGADRVIGDVVRVRQVLYKRRLLLERANLFHVSVRCNHYIFSRESTCE